MTALEYLDSLIGGMKMGSSIPVQKSELDFLRLLMTKPQSEIFKSKVDEK